MYTRLSDKALSMVAAYEVIAVFQVLTADYKKTRAKGPSESSKERNTPRKEDRSASSGAEGDVSSEREP